MERLAKYLIFFDINLEIFLIKPYKCYQICLFLKFHMIYLNYSKFNISIIFLKIFIIYLFKIL
jgi:hypothetical protein